MVGHVAALWPASLQQGQTRVGVLARRVGVFARGFSEAMAA
jgi:hypothetical protein